MAVSVKKKEVEAVSERSFFRKATSIFHKRTFHDEKQYGAYGLHDFCTASPENEKHLQCSFFKNSKGFNNTTSSETAFFEIKSCSFYNHLLQ